MQNFEGLYKQYVGSYDIVKWGECVWMCCSFKKNMVEDFKFPQYNWNDNDMNDCDFEPHNFGQFCMRVQDQGNSEIEQPYKQSEMFFDPKFLQ